MQGAIPQDIKWKDSTRDRSIDRYLSLTRDYWDYDVIIWPETALPALPENIPRVISFLTEAAKENNTEVLVGAPTWDSKEDKYYNSLLQFGSSIDKYSKRRLVPYGEYFPGAKYFRSLERFLLIPMSDLSPGKVMKNSFIVRGKQVGTLICYEIAFKDVAFSSLPKSNFLVNISNDAWFGDTSAPFQHLQIARVRALESGRSIARSTNTGLTVLIDHKGRIIKEGPLFVPTVVTGTITGRTGSTPYVSYGDAPVLLLSIVVIFLFLQKPFRCLIYPND